MLAAVFGILMLTERLLDQLLVLRFVNFAASLAELVRNIVFHLLIFELVVLSSHNPWPCLVKQVLVGPSCLGAQASLGFPASHDLSSRQTLFREHGIVLNTAVHLTGTATSLAAHTRGRNILFATGTGDHRTTANHVFAARGQTVQRAGSRIATADVFQSIFSLHGLAGLHHLLNAGKVSGNRAAFLIATAGLTATLVGVRLVGHVQASAGNDTQTGIANRGVHGAAVHLASAATLLQATDMGPAELRGIGLLDVAIDIGIAQIADNAAVLAGLATGVRRTGAAFGLHADLAATLISAGRNRTQASLGPRVHGFFRLPARGVNLLVGVSRKALGLLLHCGPCGLCHLRHYSSP